jgi:RNA polymerase sigma-70 factor (ECF subfamily)
MPNPKKKDFERFYNLHIDKVYRFVFFRVGYNKTVAEDLVSEIFMKALEHFVSYDEKISRSAWVMTIAKNHLANYWRDEKKTEVLPDDEMTGYDALWLDLSAKMADKSEKTRELYELLAQLEQASRHIVTFHYIFGYSYSEIAETLNMTETAAKVAAHRAIKKLSGKI